jgi:hypothetical protein
MPAGLCKELIEGAMQHAPQLGRQSIEEVTGSRDTR